MKHCWKNALGSVNRSCLWQEAYSLFYTPVLLEEEKFLIILIFIKIKKLAEHQTSEETDLRQCWQGRWR